MNWKKIGLIALIVILGFAAVKHPDSSARMVKALGAQLGQIGDGFGAFLSDVTR